MQGLKSQLKGHFLKVIPFYFYCNFCKGGPGGSIKIVWGAKNRKHYCFQQLRGSAIQFPFSTYSFQAAFPFRNTRNDFTQCNIAGPLKLQLSH